MSRLPVRSLLFGGVAVAMAGATIYLGQNMLNAGDAAVAAPTRPPIDVAAQNVLVAARPLAAGATVGGGDLAWRAWPRAGIAPDHIREGSASIANFTGHIVRADLNAGEPVTAARLVAAGSSGALAAVTRPGLRAVSVALTATSGVSGLIVPGDRVDVVLTYAVPQPSPAAGAATFERRAATTILSDLRVLAIDQRLSAKSGATPEIRNASLEVTAKQSEMLALAADLGKLTLSLRSLGVAADARGDAGATGGSTLDYQVGRLLPAPGRRSVAANTPRRAAVAALTQFHGSKSDAAGAGQ